jgi:hypothetical protein
MARGSWEGGGGKGRNTRERKGMGWRRERGEGEGEIPGAAVQDAITALRVAVAAAPVSEGRLEREGGQIGVKCGGEVEDLGRGLS